MLGTLGLIAAKAIRKLILWILATGDEEDEDDNDCINKEAND